MKTEDLILLIAVGVAAWVFLGSKKATAAQVVNVTPDGILPGSPGYGWQYYSDGITIDPQGVYRLNGEVKWKPEGVE